MKTIFVKLILGTLVLLLNACAHYPRQSYQPYAHQYPAYGNGYVIEQRRYYGDYPYGYRYNTYNYYDHRSDDDGNYDDHHHGRRDRDYARPQPRPMPVVPGGFKRYDPDELRYLQSRPGHKWPSIHPKYENTKIRRAEPGQPGFKKGKSDLYSGDNDQRHKRRQHSDQKIVLKQYPGFRQ